MEDVMEDAGREVQRLQPEEAPWGRGFHSWEGSTRSLLDVMDNEE